MATRPDVDATAIQKLAEEHQQIVYALKLEFDTETIRIHSGLGELTIDGENTRVRAPFFQSLILKTQ